MAIELQTRSTSKESILKLEKQGLKVKKTFNADVPELPKDITSIDDESLMDLYSRYVAYLEFINLQVWCAQTDETEVAKTLQLEKATQKLTRAAKGKTAGAIDAEIETDLTYQGMYINHRELYNYLKLLQLLSDNISEDIKLVSRELTRRTSTNNFVSRSRNFNA